MKALDHIVPIWMFKPSRTAMFFVSSRSSFKYGQVLTFDKVLTLPIVNGAGSEKAFPLRYGRLCRALEHWFATTGTPVWRTGHAPATGLVAFRRNVERHAAHVVLNTCQLPAADKLVQGLADVRQVMLPSADGKLVYPTREIRTPTSTLSERTRGRI